MADKHIGSEGYEPAIHWITREKNCARQETVRRARPSHADPTADEAISNIIREEKKSKRSKPSHRPRIGVWRWDDEQRKEERSKKDV